MSGFPLSFTGGSSVASSAVSLRQVVAPTIALGGSASGGGGGGRIFPGRFDVDAALPPQGGGGGIPLETLLLIGGVVVAVILATG